MKRKRADLPAGPSAGRRSVGGYLRIAAWVLPLAFILFKCCYPYADFFTDSYTYIDAAASHDTISYRPIGYSFFLSLVHAVTVSDTFLVLLQYLLVQGASLYLFFTLRTIIRPSAIHASIIPPSTITEQCLFFFLLLDPAPLYVSNYISSDALFIGLSLAWIAVLIRLIHRPSWGRLISQTILLGLIFGIRYNALYYPAIAALAFILSGKSRLSRKAGANEAICPPFFVMTGIALSLLIVGLEIEGTRYLTRQQTGVAVFSAFSGWQIANNALHVYSYVATDSTSLPSRECRDLDRMVRKYFDSAGPALRKVAPAATVDYMWMGRSPLKQYLAAWQQKDRSSYLVAWTRVSPVFSQYGAYLIRRHPLAFSRYYLWPSAQSFFLPPLVELAQYNEGKMQVDAVARDWFHYSSTRVHAVFPAVQGKILSPLPWIYLLVNGLFVVVGLGLFFGGGRWAQGLRGMDRFRGADGVRRPEGLRRTERLWRTDPAFFRTFLLIGAFWISNVGFSVVAAPSVLRYQILPLIVVLSFTVLAGDR